MLCDNAFVLSEFATASVKRWNHDVATANCVWICIHARFLKLSHCKRSNKKEWWQASTLLLKQTAHWQIVKARDTWPRGHKLYSNHQHPHPHISVCCWCITQAILCYLKRISVLSSLQKRADSKTPWWWFFFFFFVFFSIFTVSPVQWSLMWLLTSGCADQQIILKVGHNLTSLPPDLQDSCHFWLCES